MAKDFSGQNLRGRSFKGQDLTGANFSYAYIQGADFTNAILRGANFSHAKAGLKRRRAISLLIVSFILAAISGFSCFVIGSMMVSFFLPGRDYNIIAGIAVLLVLAVFSIVIIRQGLEATLGVVAVAMVVIAVAAAAVGVVAGAGAVAAAAAVAVAGAVVGAMAAAAAGAGAAAVAVSAAAVGAVAVAMAMAVAVAVAVAMAVAVAAAAAGAAAGAVAAAMSWAAAAAAAVLSAYIGWRAIAGDKKYAVVRRIAVSFAATGGTSFRGANLTNANFTQAKLKSTDLRKANVTRTCWANVKKLDFARVGGTILIDSDVRDLLVTGQGRNKRYIGRNLKGANLAGADLRDADLTEADISDATLEGACLERANLTKIQALGANFNQAILTSACLEAWNIDSTTQLDGAVCEYVYLLNNQQERRPSSGEFAPGEFTKLFQEVLNTVDLIFRDGIDWKAFTYSFNKLILDNEGTELEIQSIENKGDGVVVVRVSVPPNTNKAKIHSEFNQNYEVALKALEARYQAELKAKDDQIIIYREKSADMKEIASSLANRPVTVEVKATAESKAMNESADKSRKIEFGSVGGDFNASGQALNLGNIDISGTVTNTIGQLQASNTPEATKLADLLKQLQAAIEVNSDLKLEDKADALEQVKVLAEAGQSPKKEETEGLVRKAIKILKATVAELPTATKLVEACNQLLPAIAKLLGLG